MPIVVQRGSRGLQDVPVPVLPSLSSARVAFIPVNSDTLGRVEVDMTSSPVLTSAAPTYDTVSRPFRQAVNRWTGFGLETQVIEVMFAGEWNPAMQEQADVTDWVSSLHFLAQPPGGTTEPPLLRLEGPGVYGRGADERWQMVSVEQKPGTLISRSSDGRIGQIEYTVTLSKWFSSTLITIRSPAQKAKEAAGAPPVSAPSKTYTVASGDTLSRIAQRTLGNANRWPELASLNGIRDPNKLKIGQVLKLP